jgi:hypothetical protein
MCSSGGLPKGCFKTMEIPVIRYNAKYMKIIRWSTLKSTLFFMKNAPKNPSMNLS